MFLLNKNHYGILIQSFKLITLHKRSKEKERTVNRENQTKNLPLWYNHQRVHFYGVFKGKGENKDITGENEVPHQGRKSWRYLETSPSWTIF